MLVTGGNGGIGLGIADGCAAAGADVAIWGTNTTKLAVASESLRTHGGRVMAQQVDVSDEEQVETSFAAILDELGKVDAAVANAGVSGGAPFIEQTLETWRRVQAINTDGAFLTLRAAARHMVERGEGGALVGTSSTSAIHGAPGAQPYAHSKAGMLAMMRGLAVELARYGIRANSIIPGWVETEMTEGARQYDKFLDATTKRTPVRRWGVPADFAAAGAWLCDPSNPWHTGDEIVIDGGYTRF